MVFSGLIGRLEALLGQVFSIPEFDMVRDANLEEHVKKARILIYVPLIVNHPVEDGNSCPTSEAMARLERRNWPPRQLNSV